MMERERDRDRGDVNISILENTHRPVLAMVLGSGRNGHGRDALRAKAGQQSVVGWALAWLVNQRQRNGL